MRAILAAGADVHASDDFALRVAARDGNLAMVQYLLAAGADVHAEEDFALLWAAEYGHLAVVQCLLAAGADIHARDDIALRGSAENGQLEIVQYLLSVGANVHHTGNEGALQLAAHDGYDLVVRLLLAHGASMTGLIQPLGHYAATVQVALLEYGAVIDVQGLSAIALAKDGVAPAGLCVLLARQGQTELAAMLQTTQMLEPLAPEERADLIDDFLQNHAQPEIGHGRP